MVQILGHLHPLVVHLPIGGWVLAGMLEVLAFSSRFRHANRSNGYLLTLSAGSGLVAAACGWLLAESGDYSGSALQWHRWLGVGLAGAMVLCCWLRRAGMVFIYRGAFAATLLLLGITGHFGGVLTHGEGFLFSALGPHRAAPSVADASAVGSPLPDLAQRNCALQVILPVLQRRCVECHGASKQKGGLRLDSLEGMMAGGDNGPAVSEGNAQTSLLIRRLMLPVDDEDHMPPAGKAQPSADEIALLRWWIDAGAPTNTTIGSMKPSADVERHLEGAAKNLH